MIMVVKYNALKNEFIIFFTFLDFALILIGRIFKMMRLPGNILKSDQRIVTPVSEWSHFK